MAPDTKFQLSRIDDAVWFEHVGLPGGANWVVQLMPVKCCGLPSTTASTLAQYRVLGVNPVYVADVPLIPSFRV
ncbi:MAG: hypothetical protein OXH29_00865 [bacterium]|nr:hypothetical protein [bacterium]